MDLLTIEGDPVPPEVRLEPQEPPEQAPRRQTVAVGRVLRRGIPGSSRIALAGAFAAALMPACQPAPATGFLHTPEPEPTPQQQLAHEVAAAVERVAANRRAAPRWLRHARRDVAQGGRNSGVARASEAANQEAIMRATERRALRAEKRRKANGRKAPESVT